MDTLFLFIATFAHCGYLPQAPGVWASALAALIWLIAALVFAPLAPACYGLVVAIFLGLGAICAGAAEKIVDRPDPDCVVIDQVTGQLIALFAAPPTALAALAGLAIFLIMEHKKPFPVAWINEHIHGGLGLMADDAVAGIYALGVMQAGIFLLSPLR